MKLYIDPGTGSMLFTVLLGLIGAAMYSLRMLFIKLRFALNGGKAEVSTKKLPLVILPMTNAIGVFSIPSAGSWTSGAWRSSI